MMKKHRGEPNVWKKAWSIAILSFTYLLQRSHSRYTCMCIQKVHVFPPWLILYPCKNHLMYQGCGVTIVYTDRLCFPLRWICVFPRRSVWGLLTIEILLHGDNTDTAVIKGSINTWEMDFNVNHEFMLSDFRTQLKLSLASNIDKTTSKHSCIIDLGNYEDKVIFPNTYTI